MRKTFLCLITAMLITTFLAATASRAAKRPRHGKAAKVLPRAAAAPKDTVLAYIPVDPSIEFVRLHDEWGPLRFADLSRKIKEGWMKAFFRGQIPPERALSRTLEIENLILGERIAALEREKSILADRQNFMVSRLRFTEQSFENLKVKSAKYLKLKEDYDAAKAALASAQEKNTALTLENESIKIARWIKWLFTGAVIFILGWLAGIFSARRRKKKRHPLYRV